MGGCSPIRPLRAGSIPGRGAEWTSWFNIDHPGGDGDYESLEAIRFYYRGRVCERPVAIQARTTEWELPEEVGEVVHVSPKKGFRCVNKEQPQGKTCSNYHIRFLCPLGECLSPPPRTPLALCGGVPYPSVCSSLARPPLLHPAGCCGVVPHPWIAPWVRGAGHHPGGNASPRGAGCGRWAPQ